MIFEWDRQNQEFLGCGQPLAELLHAVLCRDGSVSSAVERCHQYHWAGRLPSEVARPAHRDGESLPERRFPRHQRGAAHRPLFIQKVLEVREFVCGC